MRWATRRHCHVDRAAPPDEDEQYEIYRAVAETMHPRPATLRTFDIGGDKFVSTFQVPPEMNPALGLRAVRLALRRPEVFLVQLRAMVRASAHGDVRIMVPMVASVDEMRAVRGFLRKAIAEVDVLNVRSVSNTATATLRYTRTNGSTSTETVHLRFVTDPGTGKLLIDDYTP